MELRKVYRKMMEAQIEEWKTRLSELESEAEHKKGAARICCKKNIETLGNKIETVQEKLKELRRKEADNEAWHAHKEGFEKAIYNLRSVLYKARSHFE